MRELWNRINLSPQFMRTLNGWIIVLLFPWTILMIPGLPLFALGQEVWYVTLISHVALILSALAAFEAARTEVRQEDNGE